MAACHGQRNFTSLKSIVPALPAIVRTPKPKTKRKKPSNNGAAVVASQMLDHQARRALGGSPSQGTGL